MKLKKYSLEALFFAFFSLAVLPCQQFLVKRAAEKTVVPPPQSAHPEDGWSESALCGNAGGVMKMIFFYLQKNAPAAAEEWMKFGSMTLQAPSVMLFYGDWLKQKGEPERAAAFYRLALKKGRTANAPAVFLRTLEQRLQGGR